MNERRTASRKRSFLKGTVYFNGRLSSVDCVIRDFSDAGARLEFASIVTLPDGFELYIPTRDQTLDAHVRWRNDNEVGITFAAAEAHAVRESGVSGDLEQRVKTLEHDLARLQRLVADLRNDLRRVRGDD